MPFKEHKNPPYEDLKPVVYKTTGCNWLLLFLNRLVKVIEIENNRPAKGYSF